MLFTFEATFYVVTHYRNKYRLTIRINTANINSMFCNCQMPPGVFVVATTTSSIISCQIYFNLSRVKSSHFQPLCLFLDPCVILPVFMFLKGQYTIKYTAAENFSGICCFVPEQLIFNAQRWQKFIVIPLTWTNIQATSRRYDTQTQNNGRLWIRCCSLLNLFVCTAGHQAPCNTVCLCVSCVSCRRLNRPPILSLSLLAGRPYRALVQKDTMRWQLRLAGQA